MNHECGEGLGRVGVVMGGCSAESHISMKSGRAVAQGLRQAGADVVEIVLDTDDDQINQLLLREAQPDTVFITLHGRYGEDGTIQTLLETMGLPYIGSDPQASRLAFNKAMTQPFLKNRGWPVADFCVIRRNDASAREKVEAVFHSESIVVKPACQGSSIGISIVGQGEDPAGALARAFDYDDEVLVERFIGGRELTVGILGDQALPVVEIRAQRAFFDYEAKYQKGLTEYLVPARIPSSVTRQVQDIALGVFCSVGCRDFARVDFLLSSDDKPVILEINTIPGFTETSLLPMAAQQAGYDFSQLCVTLAAMARSRTLCR